MDYAQLLNTIKSDFSQVDFEDIKPSRLLEHKAAIEAVIRKPVPIELEDFYSFCDGLQRSTYGKHNKYIAGYELLLPLEEVFDNFKIHTATLTREMLEDGTVYENEPFFENIWYDYYIDEAQTNIDTEEGRIYFEFIRRQKLLCFIVGTTFNFTIDFYDKEKPYQIYLQHSEEPVLYSLHISLEKFYFILLQIGFTGCWYAAFLKEEDKEAINIELNTDEISNEFPTFDFALLK